MIFVALTSPVAEGGGDGVGQSTRETSPLISPWSCLNAGEASRYKLEGPSGGLEKKDTVRARVTKKAWKKQKQKTRPREK